MTGQGEAPILLGFPYMGLRNRQHFPIEVLGAEHYRGNGPSLGTGSVILCGSDPVWLRLCAPRCVHAVSTASCTAATLAAPCTTLHFSVLPVAAPPPDRRPVGRPPDDENKATDVK